MGPAAAPNSLAYEGLDLWQTLAGATAQERPTRFERGASWLPTRTNQRRIV